MRLYIFVLLAGLVCFGGVGFAVDSDVVYYAVMVEGKKIGFSEHRRVVENGKVVTTDAMRLTIVRMGVSMVIDTSETSIETIDGRAIGFESVMDLGGMGQEVKGKINSEGKFDVVVKAAGQVNRQVIELAEGAVMAEGMRLLELKKGLIEGVSYDLVLFSPAMLVGFPVRVTVGGREKVDLFGRVRELVKVEVALNLPTGSVNTVSYMNEEFVAAKTVIPMMGMRLELLECDKAFAVSDDDVVDFLDKMLVQSPDGLGDVKNLESVTYYISPVGEAKLAIPGGDGQEVEQGTGGKLVVRVQGREIADGGSFPYAGKDAEAVGAMGATVYLQSEHEDIIALAKRAVGDTKDAGEAVRRIESFVDGYIVEKNLSVGYATALDVAMSREGDCSEHAVLCAAMCRAVGIPARVACGLVYIERSGEREHVFGGHAWTQAYVGGRWVGVDATRSAIGFGGGHITLAVGDGDPSNFFSMINTLGWIKIDRVVTVAKKK